MDIDHETSDAKQGRTNDRKARDLCYRCLDLVGKVSCRSKGTYSACRYVRYLHKCRTEEEVKKKKAKVGVVEERVQVAQLVSKA